VDVRWQLVAAVCAAAPVGSFPVQSAPARPGAAESAAGGSGPLAAAAAGGPWSRSSQYFSVERRRAFMKKLATVDTFNQPINQ